MNKSIREESIKLINKIVFNINNKNIDTTLLCERIYMDYDEFIKVLNNPSTNLSLYLEILDVINEM